MTVDVEARLREAGDAVRQSAAALTPPEPRRHRPAGRTVALALAVVAVLAGVAVAMRGHESATGDLSTDAGSIPRLLPDVLPIGLAPTNAADLPADDLPTDAGVDLAIVDLTVYGGASATDPFATTDLGVMRVP